MLALRDLRKNYGHVCALDDVTFEAPEGQVTAVVGPNASGKTTLMKVILGLVRPGRGEVLWRGEPLHGREGFQRLLGYMPQAPNFPTNLTAAEVARIVAELRGEGMSQFEALAAEFRLQPFWSRQIGTLSAGTRQKLSAVLALGVQAPILILDEPTVGFDPAAAVVFRRLMRKRRDAGATILFVSHLIQEVETIADRIVFIEEGKVRFSGTRSELTERSGAHSLEEAVQSFFDC
jgi:Cu-processing system ATP-binding protein